MNDRTARLLEGMRFRCIGPPRGGRVVAVGTTSVRTLETADLRETIARFGFGAKIGIELPGEVGHAARAVLRKRLHDRHLTGRTVHGYGLLVAGPAPSAGPGSFSSSRRCTASSFEASVSG